MSSYIEKNLPKDLEFWKSKFEGENAILNKDHPLSVARRNSNTLDSDAVTRKFFHEKYGTDIVSYETDS
jgi:hypothetical protein